MAMAFTWLGSYSGVVKFFEIRLDQDVLVLRGSPTEAASAVLRGTLVLCLAEPFNIKKIMLRLQGTSRIGYSEHGPPRNYRQKVLREESPFYRKEIVLLNPTKSESLPAGNYEYPFEIVIPGDSPESVEGLGDSWVIYRLKATIERGRLLHNLYARKHMRIVRTLGPSALELAHEMSVDNVWASKIEYSISIPSKACIFGTSLPTTMKLVPLLKGLKLDMIEITLTEGQEYTVLGRTHRYSRDITSLSLPMGLEEVQPIDEAGQEGWLIHQTIPLPSTLTRCVQDVETMGIRVRHKIRYTIQLTNPDGHLSEVRAQLPVQIFISPNLMVDERNEVAGQTSTTAQALENLQDHAPPLYGEHQFDQLWSEIDPSGYMTPSGAVSGVSTPLPTHSRNASTENLPSLVALSQSNSDAIPPQALHYRLSNLPDHVPSQSPRSSVYFRPPNSLRRGPSEEDGLEGPSLSPPGDDSNPLSRQTTGEVREESPVQASEHLEFNAEDLSKVPSYRTAVRAPVGTAYHGDLPNYEAATGHASRLSAPPTSPESGRSGTRVPTTTRLRTSLFLPNARTA